MNLNATLIAQTIVFFVLAWFTMKLVWPPIMKALDERAGKIADGLAAAEKGKQDLASAETRAGSIDRDARTRAQELIAAAEKRAAAIVEEAKTAARSEGERIIAAAQAEASQEAARLRRSPSPVPRRFSPAKWTPRPTKRCSPNLPGSCEFPWPSFPPSPAPMPKPRSRLRSKGVP